MLLLFTLILICQQGDVYLQSISLRLLGAKPTYMICDSGPQNALEYMAKNPPQLVGSTNAYYVLVTKVKGSRVYMSTQTPPTLPVPDNVIIETGGSPICGHYYKTLSALGETGCPGTKVAFITASGSFTQDGTAITLTAGSCAVYTTAMGGTATSMWKGCLGNIDNVPPTFISLIVPSMPYTTIPDNHTIQLTPQRLNTTSRPPVPDFEYCVGPAAEYEGIQSVATMINQISFQSTLSNRKKRSSGYGMNLDRRNKNHTRPERKKRDSPAEIMKGVASIIGSIGGIASDLFGGFGGLGSIFLGKRESNNQIIPENPGPFSWGRKKRGLPEAEDLLEYIDGEDDEWLEEDYKVFDNEPLGDLTAKLEKYFSNAAADDGYAEVAVDFVGTPVPRGNIPGLTVPPGATSLQATAMIKDGVYHGQSGNMEMGSLEVINDGLMEVDTLTLPVIQDGIAASYNDEDKTLTFASAAACDLGQGIKVLTRACASLGVPPSIKLPSWIALNYKEMLKQKYPGMSPQSLMNMMQSDAIKMSHGEYAEIYLNEVQAAKDRKMLHNVYIVSIVAMIVGGLGFLITFYPVIMHICWGTKSNIDCFRGPRTSES